MNALTNEKMCLHPSSISQSKDLLKLFQHSDAVHQAFYLYIVKVHIYLKRDYFIPNSDLLPM